jgi:hypothetical protein
LPQLEEGTAAWPSSQTTADAVIDVDTRADVRASCLLDHMGWQVAETTMLAIDCAGGVIAAGPAITHAEGHIAFTSAGR